MKKKLIWAIGALLIIVVIITLVVLKNRNSNLTSQLSSKSTIPNSNSTYTLTQVSTHSSSTSCWMVISGNVYDVTSYIPAHPNNQIIDGCGKDATEMFNSVGKHMGRATSMLSDYLVGTLSN
jgi:cytochrome b involved in lipid metabolism